MYMNLLICTQAVDKNDPILGFFHRWIEEFAKYAEHIHVICLKEGAHDLPKNVTVHSLKKTKSGASNVLNRIRYIAKLKLLSWKLRNEYDSVFVHMNPEYVLVSGLLWRLLGKKISLWYTHKNVDWKLHLAEKLTHRVFTASKESFRLESNKTMVVGHGIDMQLFTSRREKAKGENALKLLTVGRISSTKQIDVIIAALGALVRKNINAHLTVVGVPITEEDQMYFAEVQNMACRDQLSGKVHFVGAVTHDQLPSYYEDADVFINMSRTGSLDKAVLEALAMGMPVVTGNEAFHNLLNPLRLWISEGNPDAIVETILRSRQIDMRAISEKVRKEHSLTSLISNITATLET